MVKEKVRDSMRSAVAVVQVVASLLGVLRGRSHPAPGARALDDWVTEREADSGIQ